jgi:hypothetical protein
MTRTGTEYEQLRARIARLRRRIDRRASRAVDHAASWVSWRSYVSQYPGRALAAAAGVGFALSTVAARLPWPDRFGVRLYDLAIQGAWPQIWDLVRQVVIGRSGDTDGDAPRGKSE